MRGYTVSAKIASFTAAKTLLYVANPTDTVLVVMSASVSAPDDDVNEQVDCCLQRVTVIGSPAGTTVTPAKHSKGDAASGVTCLASLTTEPTTYNSVEQIGRFGGSSVGGWVWQATNIHEWMEISPSEAFGLRILTNLNTGKALSLPN